MICTSVGFRAAEQECARCALHHSLSHQPADPAQCQCPHNSHVAYAGGTADQGFAAGGEGC